MAYFYAPAPAYAPPAYAPYALDDAAAACQWLAPVDDYSFYDPQPQLEPPLYAPQHAHDVYPLVASQPSPVPIYTVSYSLANAMTPLDDSGRKPSMSSYTVPSQSSAMHCLPPPLSVGEMPTRYSESEASSLSTHSPCYSPDVASFDDLLYEPDVDGSSLSSLSPSPGPSSSTTVVKLEDASETSVSAQMAQSRRGAGSPRARSRRPKAGDGPDRESTAGDAYECDVCGTRFVRKHDGERHRRSHTGERPFPCHGGCGKAFRRADARSRHWSVYRDCEWRHTLFLEGTPEGLKRERRIRKRQKRAELVAQGMPPPMIERLLKKM